jgi:hypothetical protein
MILWDRMPYLGEVVNTEIIPLEKAREAYQTFSEGSPRIAVSAVMPARPRTMLEMRLDGTRIARARAFADSPSGFTSDKMTPGWR